MVRYLTHAFGAGAAIDPSDRAYIDGVISAFDPTAASPALTEWLEKNGPRLITDAESVADALEIVDKIGLKAKLSPLSDVKRPQSLAWWLNKRALRPATGSEPAGPAGPRASLGSGRSSI